jgi:hypothetical protein
MKFVMLCFLLLIGRATFGQTGTYFLKMNGGASGRIAVVKVRGMLHCQVFAWWAGASGRTGNFEGTAKRTGNTYLFKSADDPGCGVKVVFAGQILNAIFGDCMLSNLAEDFSGSYRKMTSRVPGKYSVKAAKAYFYPSAHASTRKNSYLVKGDLVEVELENISGDERIRVNYAGKNGSRTSGYLNWAEL